MCNFAGSGLNINKIMKNKNKKGGVVLQKSTLESFNPEDAIRGEILINTKKKIKILTFNTKK